MNLAIILSAGTGSRFGNELPKQYHMLMGKEVIAYSIEAVKESLLTDHAAIVADPALVGSLTKKYGIPCIGGGSSRNESLKKGLDFIKTEYPECSRVFISEAARPFLTAGIVDRYIGYLDDYDAVITAQRITDSLGCGDKTAIDRDNYYLIQAPEAFKFELLYRYFSASSLITATVQQLPRDRRVMKYFEFRSNMKITHREDLLRAELLMRLRNEGATNEQAF
jgi:2-C-methyl-D-erythritol 4-phosphate cytidylyltransferase